MTKTVLIVVVLVAALAGVAVYSGVFSREPAEAAGGLPGRRRGARAAAGTSAAAGSAATARR